MPILVVVLGSALVVVLAAAIWWWRTSPGKRLRFGEFTLYYTKAVTVEEANRVTQYLMRENFSGQQMDARCIWMVQTYQLQLICSGQPFRCQSDHMRGSCRRTLGRHLGKCRGESSGLRRRFPAYLGDSPPAAVRSPDRDERRPPVLPGRSD